MSAISELDLTHLNLDASDLDASERFYRDIFGLPVERRESSLSIRHPSYLLVLSKGTPSVGGSFHFGFRTAGRNDVDAWIAKMREAGVRILREPAEAGAVYVARVADPDGYEIEIYTDLA